ncbi:MAG: hypothetical protein JWO72_3258 [Caulobacteraceae bacterium]|jgi:hypothetical protein|nr:hypothetical protein [Caulobacteraceae bacterium]
MAKPDDKESAAKAAYAAQQKAREQRLAKALRENLRRRKAPGLPASDPTESGGR